MKMALNLGVILPSVQEAQGGTVVGPEGGKILWFLLFLLVGAVLLFFTRSGRKKGGKKTRKVPGKALQLTLEKSSKYYPDYLTLTVHNRGSNDVDIDKPLLIFDNFWLKRKFRLKGMNQYHFYPLYLEKGKSHTLQIDLNRFYQHDKSLKKYPKAKVRVYDIKGKRLGGISVFLRKTFFRF